MNNHRTSLKLLSFISFVVILAVLLQIMLPSEKISARSFESNKRASALARNNATNDWDITPVFTDSFESLTEITNNGGTYSGITIETGKDGNGVRIDSNDSLYYNYGINPNRGTIRFWMKPSWDGTTNVAPHYLLDWKQNAARFRILTWHSSSSNKNYLVFHVTDGNGADHEVSTSSDEPNVIMQWQPNTWHEIIAYWDFTIDDQYWGMSVDGHVYTNDHYSWNMTETPTQFWFGTDVYGDYQANAVMDELRIYDQSIWDPDDPVGSIELITCGSGTWEHHETIHNCPEDSPILDAGIHPGEDILFYKTAPFDDVYEGTAPEAAAITDTIAYRIAKDEYDPLFFNVYSRAPLSDVVVSMSDFSGPQGVLSASNAELRIVNNWWQAGTGPMKDGVAHYVPELLLFDDSIDLEGQTWDYDTLPAMPPLDHAETSLESYTSKQFVIILHAPETTAAGHYTSTVTLTASNHAAAALTLTLEVLPFTLRDTGRTVVIYHTANIDTPTNGYYVPMDRYQAQLDDIKQHSFNGTAIYGSYPTDNIPLKVQKNSEAGLTKRAILMTYYDDGVSLLESYGYLPYFYGVDEPTYNNNSGMHDQIVLSQEIHNGGGLVTTAISKQGEEDLKDCNSDIYDDFPPGTCEPLDMANLFAPSDQTYLNGLIDGSSTKTDYETYYWQAMQENPQINRFMSGYYLWNTGLDGIFPYVYQDVRNNPYDDFDIWNSAGDYRDHLVTYPSQNGPVPTIQWEALREGLDDVRYLATWDYYNKLAASVDATAAQASEQTITDMLAHYNSYSKIGTSMEQYATDRDVVIAEILAMKDIVETNITPPTLTIHKNGDSLDLSWNHNTPFDAYQIWRSDKPYFELNGEEATLLATIDAPGNSYTDSPPPTLIGDVSTNYTYRIQGIIDGLEYGLSNRAGEFDFSLIPGN